MRVVIIGGYGVFGGRLARLLLRDGHQVWIAGRELPQAQRFAQEHGGTPLRLDRMGDLSPILQTGAEAVVDAAGPYQAYRAEALKVPRFCADHALHYLDLSDDAQFTSSISELDIRAREAGCVLLSGVSSVPALSSSAVASLAGDLDTIECIDLAILPGNRAPRGRSLVTNILSQVGTPLRVWRGGAWRELACWSAAKAYTAGKGVRRRAWVFGVPDLQLLPGFFGARSVLFRAGLELGVFSHGLSALGWVRRAGLGQLVSALAPVAHRVAGWLEPFGTDRGAMVVAVTGRSGQHMVERRWELVVEAGDGPFIPTVAARALLRDLSCIAHGARPCLDEIAMADLGEAMCDLAVATRVVELPAASLFETALQEDWEALPQVVRRAHQVYDMEVFTGRADVERGSGVLSRIAAALFRFPKAGTDVPLMLTKRRTEAGEMWERNFAGRRFRSHLRPSGPHRYLERFGPFNFEIALSLEDGGHLFRVVRGWLLGIPIPKALLPATDGREYEMGGRFWFDVGLVAPLGAGLIVRYKGWLVPGTNCLSTPASVFAA